MRFFLLTFVLAGCAAHADTTPLALPASMRGKVTVLLPSDPDYAKANLGAAVKSELSSGLVVRLDQDMPAYRQWNGPAK